MSEKIVNYINQLTNLNPSSKIVNACTDITGFGLLGHLSEMLESTNSDQLKMNSEPFKVTLELDNIPLYDGVKELLDKGKWRQIEFFKSDYIASKDVNAWLGLYKVN